MSPTRDRTSAPRSYSTPSDRTSAGLLFLRRDARLDEQIDCSFFAIAKPESCPGGFSLPASQPAGGHPAEYRAGDRKTRGTLELFRRCRSISLIYAQSSPGSISHKLHQTGLLFPVIHDYFDPHHLGSTGGVDPQKLTSSPLLHPLSDSRIKSSRPRGYRLLLTGLRVGNYSPAVGMGGIPWEIRLHTQNSVIGTRVAPAARRTGALHSGRGPRGSIGRLTVPA